MSFYIHTFPKILPKLKTDCHNVVTGSVLFWGKYYTNGEIRFNKEV